MSKFSFEQSPTPSAAVPHPKPPRKRIRDNHNELERIRRNNQKAHLDALRRSLPFADMDDRASMVSIFIRAREYIEMLERRVFELQNLLGMSKEAQPQSKGPSSSSSGNVMASAAVASTAGSLAVPEPVRERLPSISLPGEPFLMHAGVKFYNPNLTPSTTPPVVHPVGSSCSEASSAAAGLRRPSSPRQPPIQREDAGDATLNADLLMSFLSESHPELLRVKRMSSDDENFMKVFRQRRESSLLLPIQSTEAVVVQKRDSLSSLFSGLLPDVVEQSALIGDVKCGICDKGVENMIMVDCDRCHRWYHLACANVDPAAIPTFWTCTGCQ